MVKADGESGYRGLNAEQQAWLKHFNSVYVYKNGKALKDLSSAERKALQAEHYSQMQDYMNKYE